MAKFGVNITREEKLKARMLRLQILEKDLREQFILGSGPGGQKINKTSSCVFLSHAPSGLEIKCQRARSQALNRFYAREELCNQVEKRLRDAKKALQSAREKERRKNRKPSVREKETVLRHKKHRAQIKKWRRGVGSDDRFS